MARKKWKLESGYSAELAPGLADFDGLTQKLLFNRGILNKADADRFFKPDYERDLGDPLAIKGMDKACERVLKAIENKEKILIHGDYDADGVSSSAIFADFLRRINFENFEVYIPDRFKEGYGMTSKSLDYILERGATLVITIDNGITNYAEIERAEKNGVNVIVVDHHIVPEKFPPAYAVVDLWQDGETYPFKDFCGSGIAFKFISAILAKNSFGLARGWEKWLLDLVAIGTVADMVPLVGENRTLVYWGLEVFKKERRIGLRAIAKKAGIDLAKATSEDISFYFAPRINVAGRLDHATLAGELLSTGSEEEAEWLSSKLEALNGERKKMADEILNEIKTLVAGKEDSGIIACGKKEWPVGVLAAVSSRVAEVFAKTTVLWGSGDSEKIKGSARSSGDVNVRDLLLKAGEELYQDVGGHPMASGFTLKEEFAEEFERRLIEAYKVMPKYENGLGEIILEDELGIDEVTPENLKLISRFEPFGQKNQKPIFLFKNLAVGELRAFGNGGIHLEMKFRNSNNSAISAIGFWMAKDIESVKAGDKIDLAASMENSTYRGYDELRLKIIDFKKV